MATKYRFIQRYRSGFPENLGEEFSDAPFARLDWIGRDRFDIQWHRHTGEWFRLHRGLTLVKAIETLSDPDVYPAPRVGRAPTPECAADRPPAAYAEWIPSGQMVLRQNPDADLP